MTKVQYFWNSARVLLFFKIFRLLAGKLRKLKVQRLTTVLALVAAGIVYKVLHRLYDAIVCRLFNLRTLNGQDEFFMYDDKNSLSNTSVLLLTDKFEFASMRDYLLKQVEVVPAIRRTIVSILGQFYFQQLSIEEFRAKWPQVCLEVKGVDSKEKL